MRRLMLNELSNASGLSMMNQMSAIMAKKLGGKILNYFGDQIQLVRAKTIRGNMICTKKCTTEEAI